MTNPLRYVTCPNCGKRLMRATPSSGVEIQCGKCREIVLVQVDAKGGVSTNIVDNKADAED